MNPMREIRLEKLTLNMGAGEVAKVEKAKNILEKISNRKVVVTKTKRRTTFGIAEGRPIGVKVILRRKEATDLLKKLLQAVNNKLKMTSFDQQGNFSFGIEEYINIPGIAYDPSVGILGLDICVTLERSGFRVKRRKVKKSKVGIKHRISAEDAIEWVKKEFGVEVE